METCFSEIVHPQYTQMVLFRGSTIADVMKFLTRRWARAFICSCKTCSSKAEREKLVHESWCVCLVALAQERTNDCASTRLRLYEFRLDEGSAWEEKFDGIPGSASAIVGDRTSLYGVGGLTDCWKFDMCSGELRALPPRPAQHGPEVVIVGDHLLVLGGYDEQRTGILTDRVSAYCPLSDSWSSLASMSAGRASGFACAAEGRMVYVAGGISDLGPSRSADVFDTVAGEWSQLAPMTNQRFCCAGVVDHDRFLAIGGQFETTCESWSPNVATEMSTVHVESQDQPPELEVPFKDMWCKAALAEGSMYVMGRTNAAVFDTINKRWVPFTAISGHSILALSTALIPCAKDEAHCRTE